MTHSQAAIIALMNLYLVPGFDYPISLLEIQKLVYFLKEAGEDLPRVDFVKHHYGPYADVLRHVLEKLEGHFITGYGAGENKPDTPVYLLPGTAEEAAAFLEKHLQTLSRFDRVAQLMKPSKPPWGWNLSRLFIGWRRGNMPHQVQPQLYVPFNPGALAKLN